MGQLMGQWVGWVLGQWVMGLGYDGSDGSWVTNGDPWSTLIYIRDGESIGDVV